MSDTSPRGEKQLKHEGAEYPETTAGGFDEAKRYLGSHVLQGAGQRVPPPLQGEGMPHGLPYTPLGVRGEFVFLLDASGTFLALRRRELANAGTIISIFAGAPGSLFRLYPVMEKRKKSDSWEPAPDRYNQNRVIRDLTQLCMQAGPFNPETQLRGRGAWVDRNEKGKERLILHCGSGLLLGGRFEALTKLNDFAYLAQSPGLPRPHDTPVSRRDASGDWLAHQLGQWRWRHPRLAPRLLTGLIAAGVLNGALPMKPSIAINGVPEWGVSALFEMVRRAFGPFLAVAHEASPQHIAEALKWDSLPLLIDAKGPPPTTRMFNRKPPWAEEAVPVRPFDGMRLCTTPIANLLGLAEYEGLLELELTGRLAGRRVEIADADEYAARLPVVARRMVDQFSRLRDKVFPAWRDLLQVQEGVATEVVLAIAMLLAAHWVLTEDRDPTDEDFEALAPELDNFMLAGRHDRLPDWKQMLDCLMGLVTDRFDETVLQEIAEAAGYGSEGEPDVIEDATYHRSESQAIRHSKSDPARRAQKRIGPLGFSIRGEEPGQRRLAVAPTAPERERLLDRTPFYARLSQRGLKVSKVLKQAPKAEQHMSTVYFPGLGSKHCVILPLDLVIGPLVGTDPEGVAEAWDRAGDDA